MKHLAFYYDPISPYAYLAFEHLPQALAGLSYHVHYKPILFAGLLKTYGQLGPAEIAPKRDWTYRQVLWQAKTLDISFQMPATHPFNPLPLLRLAVACGEQQTDGSTTTNRFVTSQIFNHVWLDGADAADDARLAALTAKLESKIHCHADAAKARLKTNTDEALQRGCFGVPSIIVDGKVFWGLDALPMLRAYLQGDAWFASGSTWDAAAQVGAGIQRR